MTPQSSQQIRPFSDYPEEAFRCEAAIYWFAFTGSLMKGGCKSLTEVFEKLPQTIDCHVSYTFVRQLPLHLANLLRKCLHRGENDTIELYRTPFANSRKIVGLTADGMVALQLSLDFVKAEFPELVVA